MMPKMQGAAGKHNQHVLQQYQQLIKDWQLSAGQVALAWLLQQSPNVVAIPGTRRLSYLQENAAAAEVLLTTEQVAALNALFASEQISGARYPDAGWAGIE